MARHSSRLPGCGWQVSLSQGEDEICDSFTATDLDAADHALREPGYLSITSAMGGDWEKLSPEARNERGTPVFRDPGE
ncbi:hypothetical protein BEH93_28230 [Streptomyces sp. 2R]|nr:hypothetical protein BEH93_28230 [Streptomyces sp. 2R]